MCTLHTHYKSPVGCVLICQSDCLITLYFAFKCLSVKISKVLEEMFGIDINSPVNKIVKSSAGVIVYITCQHVEMTC